MICGYLLGWKWTGLSKRTLWDWLDLLIVPAVLAIGGYLFTRSENRATQAAAERRAQDEALQAYLDHMSDMLIPGADQPSLYKAHPGDSLSSVARARTLTVLPSIDGDRKARVVRFLYESGLITRDRPVIDLSGADLRGANLRGADLTRASLQKVNLGAANLEEAWLREADLTGADLSGANLQGASLIEASLYSANLIDARLEGASLLMANLAYASNLGGANLKGSNLQGAILEGTTPGGVNKDLTQRQLEEADGNSMAAPGGPKTLLPPGLYPPKHWEKFPD